VSYTLTSDLVEIWGIKEETSFGALLIGDEGCDGWRRGRRKENRRPDPSNRGGRKR